MYKLYLFKNKELFKNMKSLIKWWLYNIHHIILSLYIIIIYYYYNIVYLVCIFRITIYCIKTVRSVWHYLMMGRNFWWNRAEKEMNVKFGCGTEKIRVNQVGYDLHSKITIAFSSQIFLWIFPDFFSLIDINHSHTLSSAIRLSHWGCIWHEMGFYLNI